jgi:hypothetical protein
MRDIVLDFTAVCSYGFRNKTCNNRILARLHKPASLPMMKRQSFQIFIYFQKCTMFVMSGILTITLHSFFSADDGGVSAIQADGNRDRQLILW